MITTKEHRIHSILEAKSYIAKAKEYVDDTNDVGIIYANLAIAEAILALTATLYAKPG